MTDKQINVKVAGNADFAKLEAAMERAEKRAIKLREEFEDLNGQITKMQRAGDQLKDMVTKGAGQLMTLAGGALGGGAMYGRVSGGLDQYKAHIIQLDNEARSVKALGQAYREYSAQVINAGRAYGFSNNEVVGLSSMFSSTRGRAGAGSMIRDMQTTQGFARGNGMSAMEAGGYMNRSVQMGQIGKGGDIADMKAFAVMIADATVTGGMQGREGEVIQSIQSLTGAISSKMVTVGGSLTAATALATMDATGIRGLQGQQGAALLGQLNSSIQQPGGGQAGDMFMYRALSGGKNMKLDDYRYLQEEGLGGVGPTGKSSLQALMESSTKTGLGGKYQLMAMQQLTGLSMHQVEALQQTFMPAGVFDTAKFGATEKALGPGGVGSVDASVLPLISELANGGDVGAVGKEFEQLVPGQKANTDRAGLIEQFMKYGQDNVAMSQGQLQEQHDNDMAKAAEDAGAGLLALKNAAETLATKFLEMGGAIGGPLGGIAPIALGSLTGSAISQGGQALLGKLVPMIKNVIGVGAPATATVAEGAVVAEGAAAAAVPAAVAPGAAAAFGTTAAAAFGVLAAAYLGAEIGSAISKAMGGHGFLDDYHKQAIAQGADRVMSGDVGVGEAFSATGTLMAAPIGVVAGGVMGLGSALTGGSFTEGYDKGFFSVSPGQSAGKTEWQQRQGIDPNAGGGVPAANASGDPSTVAQIEARLKDTPMAGKGMLLATLAKQYGVPVDVALAQLYGMTQFGALGSATTNNNPGNVQYTGKWGDDRQGDEGYAHFPTLDAGIEGFFKSMGGQGYSPAAAPVPSSRGGWWNVGADDTPAMLHKKEMVLPANLADEIRQLIHKPGITSAEAKTAGGEVKITISPIKIEWPGGGTTVTAQGTHAPFAGVIDYPTGG
jgi:hypothetical protein